MNVKSLCIGRLTTKNNIFVAPLAGYSDFAFRKICYELGAGLAFGEMISAKGLYYKNENTAFLTETTDAEYIKCAQLFGSDAEILETVAKSRVLSKFDILDLNCGCPVPKVYNNGEGSALLARPEVAEQAVRALKKSGKVVTVKMRLGVVTGESVAVEFAKRMEGAGAEMITLHARYRNDYYSGEPDFAECEAVKKAINIPVIFNGGIFTKEDADHAIERTGADGVMLARGALYDPTLICKILGVPAPNMKDIVKRQFTMLAERLGEAVACVNFRKQMACYLKGVRDGKKLKEKVFSAKTADEYFEVIDAAF